MYIAASVIFFYVSSSMPYVEATTLESLRMFMGRGFAVPHRAVKDTTLGGYFIPKVRKTSCVGTRCR